MAVPFTSDEEIDAIGRGLVNRSLPKSEWTHRAHFAAALWLLSRHSHADALRLIRGFIRTYNESTGSENTDTNGYHETITQASMRAANAFLEERPEQPLFTVCNELLASPLGGSEWLLAYWSRSTLFSVQARRAWVEPDVKPLPF